MRRCVFLIDKVRRRVRHGLIMSKACRRALMRSKARRRVRHVLMRSKARRRAGEQVHKARNNDG